ILMPDDSASVLDPLTEETTVIVRCDVVDPANMQGDERDPRSVARRAEDYLKSTGIADAAIFGPEPEFFIFDSVKWRTDINSATYAMYAAEAAWVSHADFEDALTGHPPGVKRGYF